MVEKMKNKNMSFTLLHACPLLLKPPFTWIISQYKSSFECFCTSKALSGISFVSGFSTIQTIVIFSPPNFCMHPYIITPEIKASNVKSMQSWVGKLARVKQSQVNLCVYLNKHHAVQHTKEWKYSSLHLYLSIGQKWMTSFMSHQLYPLWKNVQCLLAWRVGEPHSLSETAEKKISCSCQNKSWLQDLPILEKHCFEMTIRKLTNSSHHQVLSVFTESYTLET